MVTVKFADIFTDMPSGRYREDSSDSAEEFRDDILVPLLREHDIIVLDLRDVYGYPSSFLEEAFGGLIREELFTEKDLNCKLRLVDHEGLRDNITRIRQFINDAQKLI